MPIIDAFIIAEDNSLIPTYVALAETFVSDDQIGILLCSDELLEYYKNNYGDIIGVIRLEPYTQITDYRTRKMFIGHA